MNEAPLEIDVGDAVDLVEPQSDDVDLHELNDIGIALRLQALRAEEVAWTNPFDGDPPRRAIQGGGLTLEL